MNVADLVKILGIIPSETLINGCFETVADEFDFIYVQGGTLYLDIDGLRYEYMEKKEKDTLNLLYARKVES